MWLWSRARVSGCLSWMKMWARRECGWIGAGKIVGNALKLSTLSEAQAILVGLPVFLGMVGGWVLYYMHARLQSIPGSRPMVEEKPEKGVASAARSINSNGWVAASGNGNGSSSGSHHPTADVELALVSLGSRFFSSPEKEMYIFWWCLASMGRRRWVAHY